jgi:hypothetical protein
MAARPARAHCTPAKHAISRSTGPPVHRSTGPPVHPSPRNSGLIARRAQAPGRCRGLGHSSAELRRRRRASATAPSSRSTSTSRVDDLPLDRATHALHDHRAGRDYTLFFDSPSTDTRPWRVTAYAGREQQLAAPYYGIGNETAYDASLEAGPTRYYYRYGLDRFRASADVQHTLGRPSLRYLIGAGASSEKVDLTPFDSGSTLIESDLNGRQPAATRTNYVRAGLTWDTRDREIGTTSGTWADLSRPTRRLQTRRLELHADGPPPHVTINHSATRHTLANRLVPRIRSATRRSILFLFAELPTTQKSQDGLGGTSSIRRNPKDRTSGREFSCRTTSCDARRGLSVDRAAVVARR